MIDLIENMKKFDFEQEEKERMLDETSKAIVDEIIAKIENEIREQFFFFANKKGEEIMQEEQEEEEEEYEE